MNLRWRFTSGILFSLTFHALLISLLLHTYPELKSRGIWFWKEFPLFPYEKTPASVSSFGNEEKKLNILSADEIIFPYLVKTRKQKKNLGINTNKSTAKSQSNLNSILTHVNQFPGRLKIKQSSTKQLSAPVVSLLSLLPTGNMQNINHENRSFINANEQKNITSFESNELKNYLIELSKFLSEGWEVPIHLKESQVTVEIMFEINKNGRILNWELEESGSPALHNSVNNLMKNLQFLPALPKSYRENSYIFGVRFSPTISRK